MPAGQATPTARRQATRTRILDAAVEVFAEDGLQGATVATICSRAGFTRGAFYSNFFSKEQLFLELLEREFAHRAEDVAAKARELEPVLRGLQGCVSPAKAAEYVVEFFAPTEDATAWFVLEVEFLLLATRDPSIAPDHHKFMDRFYANISGAIERVVTTAGRRFTIPVAHAIPVISSVYENALRTSALVGQGSSEAMDQLGDRIAELIFALTEQTPSDSEGE